ncbi:MAG: phosphoribosylformylglycinamidine synthase, partial [Spirochaetota bacterium]
MTRLFVEKKPGFRTKAVAMQREISEVLGISAVSGVRLLQRYDLDNLRDDVLRRALHTVFADPVSDTVSYELALSGDEHAFAYAYHPGQFDQRADSAAQALNLLGRGASGFASVSCASVVVLSGAVSAAELERIQRYLVNPVDSQIVPVDRPVARESAAASAHIASQGGKAQSTADTASLEDGERSLEQLRDPANRALVAGELGLAMRNRDLEVVCEFFFDSEHRPPSVTELSIIDTYWSDHCRHTTFLTELQNITIADDPLLARARSDYRRYRQLREELGVSAGESLMDIATIGGKHARAKGRLADLEVTDEINAASLRVSGPGGEPWLLMVKNETHNHPTEIEPYGGAATCLGGAIRDPLSERSYVFQAARVTGSGDPRTPVSETWPGKLPQRTITTEAAQGFSSYGNQIGLTTGMVEEVYHPGYVAKRLEIGAVCGAAPQLHVHRSPPEVGDRIVLVGGRTGRDGCGGATGSSKAHDEASIEQAGAEVQKGNPPVERALQRLFRRPEAAALIKRCNDFGAGGVSVAIGELAEGVDVDLDVIPVKYRGLTPRELAISESQERMAVVLAPSDVQAFLSYADAENLEATVVATVTDRSRLRMYSEGSLVADIERSFLESHGAPRRATAYIAPPARQSTESEAQSDPIGEHGLTRETWLERVGRLDVCSRRGLTEMFDSTVGAGTAMAPLGGAFGATPEEAAVCELPTAAFGRPQSGETVSTLSYGFDPVLSSWSPYHGAYLAVVESVCRLVAVGARPEAIRLSLQEYFPRPGDDAKRWGLPAAALLGALGAQLDLGVPAVGGKDSMSGSFNAYDVPPTLVSFAVSAIPGDHVTGAAFSRSGSAVLLLDTPLDGLGLPHMEVLLAHSARIADMRAEGVLRAAGTIRRGGLVAALTRACLGNRIGIDLDTEQLGDPGAPRYGSFYVEVEPEGAQRILGEQGESPSVRWIGTTGGSTIRTAQWELDLATLEARWTAPLSEVFPVRTSPGTDGGAAGREAPPGAPDAAPRQEAPPVDA